MRSSQTLRPPVLLSSFACAGGNVANDERSTGGRRVCEDLMHVGQLPHLPTIMHEYDALSSGCQLEDSVNFLVISFLCVRDAHANAQTTLVERGFDVCQDVCHIIVRWRATARATHDEVRV